jgi:hypothetical protein
VTLSGEVFDIYGPTRTQATGAAFRPHAAVIRVGGLIAQLPFSGEPPWSGLLLEDHHGEVPPWVPATRGTVVRMFVWGVDAAVDPHGATLSSRRFVTREVEKYPRGGFSSGIRDGTMIRGMEEGILAHLRVTQPA